MTYCTKCGKTLKDNVDFCTECGAKVMRRADDSTSYVSNNNLNANDGKTFMNFYLGFLLLGGCIKDRKRTIAINPIFLRT